MAKTEPMTTDGAARFLKRTAGQLALWRHLGRGPRYLKIKTEGRANSIRYRRCDLIAFVASSHKQSVQVVEPKRATA
jgi:hypothetical protein